MQRNDIAPSLTIEQLKQQYNLDNKELKKAVETARGQLNKVSNELNNLIDSLIINLGELLGSQSGISLWFFSGIPTTENEPYISWITPEDHIGDFYYDRETGYVYQFQASGWIRNFDDKLARSMALTNVSIDIEDNERKVFFDQPSPPYSNGDWWIQKDGVLYICQIAKEEGGYEEHDFIISSIYENTIAIKTGNKLTIINGKVTIIEQGIDLIRQQVEENQYLEDEEGNRQLISSAVSQVIQDAKQIKLEVIENADGKKIISAINQTAGLIQIEADKVSLKGKQIDLTGDNVTIKSNNFNVDNQGNLTCKNATMNNADITGGKIKLTDDNSGVPIFSIYSNDGYSNSAYASDAFWIQNANQNNGYVANLMGDTNSVQFVLQKFNGGSNPSFLVDADKNNVTLLLMRGSVFTEILPSGITTPSVTQTSRAETKKNMEKFTNSLKIIENSDIYSYNLKTEDDKDKKHIGLVIGDNYKTPDEVISQNGEGIDTYSMLSVAWQAIKELHEENKKLKKDIEELIERR